MPKIKNDQEEIIEFCKQNKLYEVWKRVKYIGYQDISDISERFLVFNKAFALFDPYINNNFIYFYKQQLKYFKNSKNQNMYTDNQRIIRELIVDSISPSSDHPQFIKELQTILPNS